jgi:hypothetical protein
MVHRPKNRTTEQIIDDYLSAKARTDILGLDFMPTPEQRNELKDVIVEFGTEALSRSRKGAGLSKKTLEVIIPRFLKFGLTGFVNRLHTISKMASKSSWEYFCLIYGEEEAAKVWQAKATRCALSEDRLGTKKWEDWLSKRSGSFLDRWAEQLGSEEAAAKYASLRQTLSKVRTLDGYIERFGEEIGRQEYEKRYNNVNSKEYKTYARKVHRLSGKIYNENIDTINPERHSRTLNGVDGGWQLDHITPIKECFLSGIPAEEAAALENLRMLPWKDNLMRNYNKNVNCS